MKNSVKIFISQNGELNAICKGRLANISDLENAICEGHKELLGILELEDGTYYWHSAEQQRNILMLDDEITEEELRECIGEYVKVNDEINPLYQEFINDLEEGITRILSINFDNTMLVAVTRMISNQWTYTHNYSIKNNEITKTVTMIPTAMLLHV